MALNFPNTGLYEGLQYTGDNGVVYIYDGIKWVGHSPTLAPGTSSLVNGSNVVQVDGDGNLVIPIGAIIKDAEGTQYGSNSDRLVNGSNELVFDANGVLNFPNNNGQIGQLESPYTGLEFRTGSGADWIGISYGEINDNNTSYFYFDKDGSDYTTANHRAHLQIKNPAHNGHVEWLFDSDGTLTFPNGDLTISTIQGSPTIQAADGLGLTLATSGAEAGSALSWVDSLTEPTQIAALIVNNPLYTGLGDVGIVTGEYLVESSTPNIWNFSVDGVLTMPSGNETTAGWIQWTHASDDLNNTAGIGFVDNYNLYTGLGLVAPRDTNTAKGIWFGTPIDPLSPFDPETSMVFRGDTLYLPKNGYIKSHDYDESSGYLELGNTGTSITIQTAETTSTQNNWIFGSDGTTTFPDNTIKGTADTHITVLGNGPGAGSWYNIFGELNNSTSTNITIDGSVVYDTEGNLYVLGSTYADGGDFPGANLFLKYSPQGELLWRKTWTDPLGDACGSYNASMRFLPAESPATIDAIVWASNSDSWTTSDRSGYIGTMDLEGNLVDLQGQARAPLALPDYRITDIVPLFYESFNGSYVSGSWYDRADTGWNFPAIAGVDFDDVNDNVNWIFIPTDFVGGGNAGGHFKSINAVIGGLWATGSYNSSANGYYINRTILGLLAFSGDPGIIGAAYLYTIGNNYPEYSMWIEDSGSDADSNIYGLINVWGYNNDTSIQYNNHTVLASATLNSTLTIDRWQKKIRRAGADDGSLNVHGLGLANHEGYVYVSVLLSDNSGGDGDVGLLKLDSDTGAVVWARTIGSPFSEGAWSNYEGGYGSSSDIVVDPTGNYISFTAITQDQSTGTQWSNNFTIQYPLDGSLLGTFNDFSITDSIAEFVVTDHDFDVVDITSTSNITTATFAVTTATLTASATTVGEGWTNFYWPISEVDKTWTFDKQGVLTLPPGGDIKRSGVSVLGGSPDGGFADNTVGITITSETLDQSDPNFSITYNIVSAGATSAGILINGITVDHTQDITGTSNRGDNTVSYTADYDFWTHMVTVQAYVVDSRGYTFYTEPVLWDVPQSVCLVEGTQITMSDGTYKSIEDIQHGDLIRVWNFDLGEFSEAQPIWIKYAQEISSHDRFTFSDGTVLDTVGHFMFNKEAGKFTKFIEDTTPVGTTTFNEQGEEVILLSKERVRESTRYYHVWTQYHLNLFANGILTSHRFNNIYPIVDMKFVKDDRVLRDVNEFEGIDEKYIAGVRLREQPREYTAEYIKDYINRRVKKTDIANTTIEQGI